MTTHVVNVTVGMKGTVVAAAPFDSVINPRLVYQCIAVETIDGLLAKGDDPFGEIYEPNSIEESQFNLDSDTGVRIITWRAGTGEIVSIPETYISSIPDANGVPYRCTMLGISLSAIPDELDIADLKEEISDLVFNYLGVRSEIKEVVYGDPSILSVEEHVAVDQARVANITNNVSSRLRVEQLTAIVNDLTQKVQVLENYIKVNLPPA